MSLLFSYGTLRDNAVQLSIFGRRLDGEADFLLGFRLSLVGITDQGFVEASGKVEHTIVHPSHEVDARVAGVAFEVSDDELRLSDAYEPVGYERIRGMLASGRQAWLYAGVQEPGAEP